MQVLSSKMEKLSNFQAWGVHGILSKLEAILANEQTSLEVQRQSKKTLNTQRQKVSDRARRRDRTDCIWFLFHCFGLH
jgi:hypothetical protein